MEIDRFAISIEQIDATVKVDLIEVVESERVLLPSPPTGHCISARHAAVC